MCISMVLMEYVNQDGEETWYDMEDISEYVQQRVTYHDVVMGVVVVVVVVVML